MLCYWDISTLCTGIRKYKNRRYFFCGLNGSFAKISSRNKIPLYGMQEQGTVGEIEEEDDAFLGPIADTDSSEPWTVTLFLNERQLLFKINTGADVTAIPETTCIKS